MQLLTFVHHDTYRLGLRQTHGVVDVAAAAEALSLNGSEIPQTVTEFYAGGLRYLSGLRRLRDLTAEAHGDWLLAEADLQLGPVVPAPGKIICVGLNYLQHAQEAGLPVPTTPILFAKYHDTIAAPGEPIPLPSVAREYDYEAELVIVMGREARGVTEAQALDYVLGYCNGNDISARDLQTATSQWMLGKTLEKFMPVGPYLVTADAVGDPGTLGIRCWLNGELRQNSNTGDMVFSVPAIISYISRHFPLYPGDIISTGTPQGVIAGMQEKRWMLPGDTVTVEIDGLGSLTNTMVERE